MPEPIIHGQQLSELARLNAGELLRSFKLPQAGSLAWLMRAFARIPAARLAVQMVKFDRLVGNRGLTAGANFLLESFTETLSIEHSAAVPKGGPLLIVSNHPGMVDAMALWAALDARKDILTVARDQRLLRLLPNVCRHLILIDPEARSAALRQAITHLREGGALITFPAGAIEPDPAIRWVPLADKSWSGSIALLVRAVPGLMLLPAAVSGVISPTALKHPLATLFRTEGDREWAAATLQVLSTSHRNTRTRLIFGTPIKANALSWDKVGVMVNAEMNRLLVRVAS